jgi:hypothetical protein
MTDQTDARWQGRRYSLETRAKMSASAKARALRSPHSPETRAKIGVAMRGKRKSAEHRAKIAAGKRGRRFTAEHIANIAAAKRGGTLTAEHRAKIAAAVRERWARMEIAEERAK